MDAMELERDSYYFKLGFLTSKVCSILRKDELDDREVRLLNRAIRLLEDIKEGREFVIGERPNLEDDTFGKLEVYSFFLNNLGALVDNNDVSSFMQDVNQSIGNLTLRAEGKIPSTLNQTLSLFSRLATVVSSQYQMEQPDEPKAIVMQ